MDRKKKLAVGKGVSVGRSVEEIIVTRALNDVPDTVALPLIGRPRAPQQQLLSRSMSRLPSRTGTDTGGIPQVDDWNGADDGPGGMLESLAQYCKALQTKVQELQQRVDHSDAVAEVLRSDLKRVGGPGVESALTYGHGVGQSRGRRDSTASHGSSARRVSALGGHAVTFGQDSFQQQQSKQSQAHIRGVVGGMDSKVVQLRQLFTSVDPLEQRAAAATAIAAGIRGFLARRRYAVFTDSVVNWRWGRSRVFAAVLQHMTAAVSRIDKGMQRMRMKRDTLLIRNVMAKWYLVVKNVLPLRRRIAQQAEEKCLIKQFKLKMQVFLAFREGCIGTGSTKQARRARRALIEQKRSEIVEENYRVTGLRLLASEEQVMRAVHKQVLANAKEHMRARRLRLTFDRIGSLHSDMKLKTRQANRYFFKKCAGRVFYAWNNWLFLVSVGLDRRRWVAPGKYEIKYNQKQVDNFSRLRCERFCFVAWKRYTRVSSAVTMGFVKKTSALIRAYLVSWRAVVKKFKHLLREAVANWQAYPNLMVTGPFEAWKNLASSARQRREAQERVMSAYRRWKTRQKLAIILRTWRHQAVYGSVEGMYSRTNLTKSLAEQKNMGNSMQKLVSQQTLELEKCRDMIKQEVGARGTLEKTLVLKDQEIVRMKITENHTSQEIHRLHALIDAMAKINPRQMKLINKLQEEFGFTARPITGQGPALPEVNPHAIIEEAEREEVEEAASQDAADTEGVEAEGPAKRMTVRPPRPTAFIRPLTASSDATDVPTTVIKVLNISPEDESILRRTKWLLGRFMMEKDDTVPPKPLSEILREASTLESMDSTLHSDSDDSESSAVEAARMAEEHTDRDGLADKGIFGGRRRHSLVIQPSGELNISKSMSLPLSKSNLSAAVEGGDDDHSVGHEPVSLMCPHCSQGFEAEEAQMEALRAHFRGSPGNAQSLTPSQDASRRNSRAEVAHSDELCDIFDEKPPLQKKKKEKTHKRRNHSRAPRHRRRRLDPVTLEPLPLLPQEMGTIPMPLMEADFLQLTSRLMLAMSVFLTEGCTDYFNLEDRRHWAATLARCVKENAATLEPVSEGWGESSADGAVPIVDEVTLAPVYAATGAWALAEGGSDGTWREALLELRTAYPAGLHSYGMRTEESGLYQRVAEMRSHLRSVSTETEKRTAHNFSQKHPGITTLPSPRGANALANTNGSMFNLSTAALQSDTLDFSAAANALISAGSDEGPSSPLNIYSQALPLQVKAEAPSGLAGRRLMGALPDTSHLKGATYQTGTATSVSGAVTDMSPPVTPAGGSRKKKGFFSNIEGQTNEFNVDDMSLSHASQGDDVSML